MHPGDVAPLVREAADELRARTDARPELGVAGVELSEDLVLCVRFETATSEAVEGVQLAGGTLSVPIIGTRRREEFILELNCADWDSQPPTAELLDATGVPLPNERWPEDRSGRGIVLGHPLYGARKFFCRPGTREFHTHPQHEDNPWDRHRESMTLDGIVLGLLRDLTHRWTIR